MRSLGWVCLLFVGVVACGHKHGNTPDASHPCQTFGQGCAGNADCCSMLCDMATMTCDANGATCGQNGASCSANTDCCSVSCVGNVCQTTCTADNGSCSQNGECCGGTCGSNGKCTPLNATCSTDGNPCSASGTCCSGFCNTAGKCGPSSFCTQNGDACGHDAECCGGLCTIAAGATIGTCTQPSVGSTNCTGLDGQVCNDCGSCCSRLCEVYAPTGVKICQPAEGCHVDGDICRSNADCCGAAGTGLPGAGHVQCLKANSTDPVGICRNPMSCAPEGAVCHFQNFSTCGNSSSRNDCCDNLGNQNGQCKLDVLGIPRCFGLGTSCQQAGQNCATSLDCCMGTPCVNGKCGATTCVNSNGQCSQTADCCNGATCVFQAGMTVGTCGMTGTCQQLGQTCNSTTPCCMGQGTCTDVASGAACSTSTGCTCQNPIF
jgi:hypothetical protein